MLIESITDKRSTAILLLIILVAISNNLNGETRRIPLDTVLAEYRDGVFTKKDFLEEYERLPFLVRTRFITREGRREFLEATLLNHLSYLKALEMGIDSDPETFLAYREHLKPYYAGIFRQREIREQVEVNGEDIERFYSNNINRYTDHAETIIRYVLVRDPGIAAEVEKSLSDKLDEIEVIKTYSINSRSRNNEGMINNIRGTGFIPGIGRDVELDNAITTAPLNEWVGPVNTATGIHFFRVMERIPKRIKPLDEVSEDIKERLYREKEQYAKDQKIQELRQRYEIKVDDYMIATLNLFDLSPFSEVMQEKVITSSIPDLNFTVGDLYEHFSTISPYIINEDMTNSFEYYEHFRHLPREEWAELSSPETLNRLVNNIIDVNLFNYEAVQMGYEQDIFNDPERDVIRGEATGSIFDYAVFTNPEVRQLRRHAILKTFFQKQVIDVADPTREDLRAYYEENIDEFTLQRNRRLQAFLFDTVSEAQEAREIVERAVEEDDEWQIINLIRKSKYPEELRSLQFVLYNPELPIFGEDRNLYNAIWNTPIGQLSEIKRADQGFYFFLIVLEEYPEYQYPVEQLQVHITEQMTYGRRLARWQEVVVELFDEYQVVLYPERLVAILSAEELFDLAEESQARRRFVEAIRYYDQIIEHHKNDEADYKALFAKAYLLGRELDQEDKAVRLLQQLISEYPENSLHDAAHFMIQTFSAGEIPLDILE